MSLGLRNDACTSTMQVRDDGRGLRASRGMARGGWRVSKGNRGITEMVEGTKGGGEGCKGCKSAVVVEEGERRGRRRGEGWEKGEGRGTKVDRGAAGNTEGYD